MPLDWPKDRTSNMLDRLMRGMNQYFAGSGTTKCLTASPTAPGSKIDSSLLPETAADSTVPIIRDGQEKSTMFQTALFKLPAAATWTR